MSLQIWEVLSPERLEELCEPRVPNPATMSDAAWAMHRNQDPFELATFRMQDILNPLQKVETGVVNRPFFLRCPVNHPQIVAKGSISVLFSLPHIYEYGETRADGFKEYPMIGKVFGYFSDDETPQGYMELVCKGHGGFRDCLPTTIFTLQELGLDQYLPRMEEHYIGRNTLNLTYVIRQDEARDGYVVVDAEGFDFSSLENGQGLSEEYDVVCTRVLESGHHIHPFGHGTESEPESAVRHIFHVRHKDGVGQLRALDLDHLRFLA